MMLVASFSLSGCDYALMDPKGPIGTEEKSILLLATGLMMIVVVPVFVMIVAFASRYRASNKNAAYTPDWEHSTRIEAVVWLVPLMIIIALGTVTWTSSHTLDPYRPIASESKPIEVEVVSLDWKWLFIYPDLKIASVNEFAFPANTPVHFKLTSASVMNTFFVPQLGTMIYTMAGMETKLSLLANQPGNYFGLSANFSGDGFSDMGFMARAMTNDDFNKWVETVHAAPETLTQTAYRQLAKPSEKDGVHYFSGIDMMVYHDVLNKCADGASCIDDQMARADTEAALGGNAAFCDFTNPRGL